MAQRLEQPPCRKGGNQIEAGRAWFDLFLRTEKVTDGLRKAGADIEAAGTKTATGFSSKWSAGASKVTSAIGKIGPALAAIGVIVGAQQLVGFLSDSIGAASDLNETMTKTERVFGSASDSVIAMGDNAATSLGMSKNQALAAAATFGNLFRAMGFAEDKSADMSTSLVGLAADLASFNNADPSEVLEALRSGLVGETEPLRKFGININDARLRQEALNLGLKVGPGVLDANVKAQAAYSLMLKDTTLAQGDFSKTSDGLANQQRILTAQFADLQTTIGQQLLPVAVALAHWANDSLIPALKASIPVIMNVAGALGGPIVDAIGTIIRGIERVVGAIHVAMQATTDMALNFGDMGDKVHETADSVGVDFQTMKDRVRDLMTEMGLSFEDAVDQAEGEFSGRLPVLTEKAMDDTADAVTTGGDKVVDAVGDGLAAGEPTVTAGAETMVDGVPGAVSDAGAKATEEAKQVPGDIASAILDGRDEVNTAAELLSKAATDPLVEKSKIAELREQLKKNSLAYRDALKSGTPATRAAAKAEYMSTEIELAGHLLRQNPKSKEAAAILKKYLKSEDPATRDAAKALYEDAEHQAEIHQYKAEKWAAKWGVSLEEALNRRKGETRKAAQEQAQGAVEGADNVTPRFQNTGSRQGGGLARGVRSQRAAARAAGRDLGNAAHDPLRLLNFYHSGYVAGTSFAYGLRDSGDVIATYAEGAAAIAGRYLRLASPAKAGPLSEDSTLWGRRLIRGMAKGILSETPALGMSASRAAAAAAARLGAGSVLGSLGGVPGLLGGGTNVGSIVVQMSVGTLNADNQQQIDQLGYALAQRIRLHALGVTG